MKEQLVTNILNAMYPYLSEEQLERLKLTMYKNFSGVSVQQESTEVALSADKNEEILKLFLACKGIEGCAKSTIENYSAHIAPMLYRINRDYDKIDAMDFRAYLLEYKAQRNVSNTSIGNMRRVFNSFFSYLEEEDYVHKNPMKKIHKVKTEQLVKSIISEEEMVVIKNSCTSKRDIALIDTLYSTGMCVSELVKLNISDIDFTNSSCIVFGKGSKERDVYINASALVNLKEYIEDRVDGNPALFVTINNPHKRLTKAGVQLIVRILGTKANINKVHSHKFRRTMATRAADRGMPIEQISKLLGHSKIETTMHYCMVNLNNIRISHKRFIV